MPLDREPWPTLEELRREEAELELPALSESDAYELGMLAVAAAREQRLPIAVGVWRAGRQLFHCGLPGSTQDNDQWLRRKGRVVMRFEHSSLYMARLCQDQQVTLVEKFGLPASRYAAAGGAVPLRVRATGVVGWFGVSGLPQLEDHRFVVDTLRAISRQ
ncbi:heme-degrading domain-containing protein [Micromonospora coerulea]|uniref:heme-degrading domain-containing protein n=1 Tax=Micromonospora coerulea TaxID=47856 RepID=UPI0019059797|nr:heme-degrading domain-containing protein [Micromonospora veneta]